MEEVPGSCWARVYGVIGIPGSWQLLVLSLCVCVCVYLSTARPSLSFSPLSSLTQSSPKLKQWRRTCKQERTTDTRYCTRTIFTARRSKKHAAFN
jgi:hypothetical protein